MSRFSCQVLSPPPPTSAALSWLLFLLPSPPPRSRLYGGFRPPRRRNDNSSFFSVIFSTSRNHQHLFSFYFVGFLVNLKADSVLVDRSDGCLFSCPLMLPGFLSHGRMEGLVGAALVLTCTADALATLLVASLVKT
ncbi:hypothetical protein SAY86_014553 [Trapa natans]|uniref:Uncharacterized protein n=1 Tax=Trapa natans TaxID=22666 RepID=A0AAN7KYM0_TRANT|nr:hypothetical protein SAY86_014553 [Trapa natans]